MTAKINKTYARKIKKGFSLFETMIAATVFAVVTMILFGLSSDFFKSFEVQDQKQTVNRNFLVAYNNLNKDLLLSNIFFCRYYLDENKYTSARWLLFPLPTDQEGVCQCSREKPYYIRVCLYYLICANPDCKNCKKAGTGYGLATPFRFCSDKQVIKLIYKYKGSADAYMLSGALNALADDISSYILNYDGNFPDDKEYNIEGYGKRKLFEFESKKIIARNILDMSADITRKRISLTLSTARKENANKDIVYGETDFTTEPGSRYLEQLSWDIYPKNIR